MKIYLCLFIMLFLPLISQADEVYLKDDTLIKGRVVRVDAAEVEIDAKVESPVMRKERAGVLYSEKNPGTWSVAIKREEVRRLVYDDGMEVKFSGGDDDAPDNKETLK